MEVLVIVALLVIAWLSVPYVKSYLAKSKKPAAQPAPVAAAEPSVATPEPAVAASSVETVAPEVVAPVVTAVETEIEPVASEEVVPAVSETVSSPVVTSPVPEDSILHRHYLANLEAEKQAITHPYPTDSVLRRHYDTQHKVVVEAQQVVPAIIEEHVAQPAQAPVKVALPEDSVLKRHFIAQLHNQLEAELGPKPSDSVLRRHYDSLIQTQLQKHLANLNS